MTDNFLKQLPEACQALTIAPKHRVALTHFTVGDSVWVVLLTRMPGDSNKAWRLTRGEYWQLMPKHGTRDRFIRENMVPTIEGDANPQQGSFF